VDPGENEYEAIECQKRELDVTGKDEIAVIQFVAAENGRPVLYVRQGKNEAEAIKRQLSLGDDAVCVIRRLCEAESP
jgi:hypothetical protein